MSEHETCGAAVRPPRLLLATLAIGVAVDRLVVGQGLPLPDALRLGLGALLAAAGIATVIVAARQFARAGTNVPTVQPATALVTDGLYALSRNPIYVALLAVYCGLALLADAPLALLLAVPCAIVLHYGVVRREEAYLARRFGDAYRDYMDRTRRWL